MRQGRLGATILSVISCLAVDCGGVSECRPPSGVLHGELYCSGSGERGFCGRGGHPGDTVWHSVPCAAGNTCERAGSSATCRAPDGTTRRDDACALGESACVADGRGVATCGAVDGSGVLAFVSTVGCSLGCYQGACALGCDPAAEGAVSCTRDGRLATCDRRTGALALTSVACAAGARCLGARDACDLECADDAGCRASCPTTARCVASP